ncbi:MAG: hypothetical protein ACLFSV_06440 [Alkalispirochaeta sp.]
MKTKSRNSIIVIGAILTIAAFLFTGCPQPEDDDSVSIPERINAFIADANAGNYSSMYTHTHPTADKYNASKDGNFWSDDFDDSDHQLGTLNISGTVVTASITSSVTYSSDDSIRFTMLEDGSDVWMIDKLEIDTGSGYDTIFE